MHLTVPWTLVMMFKHKGFTLLESMVALVILTTVFVTVWQWYGTATITTTKVEQWLKLPLVYEQSLEKLRLESLQKNRDGSFQIEGVTVNWRATEHRISTEEFYRKQPQWIVTLFDVQLSFVTENGKPITEVSTKMVKQWKDPTFVPITE